MTTFGWRGRALLPFMSLLVAAAPTLARAAEPIGSTLVGHWQLESIDVSGNAPYGAKPQGSMLLDANGHYSVIVISDGGAPSMAYFGSYAVDKLTNMVIFHIDNATQASAIGRDEKRLVSISGGELVQQSLPAPGRPVLKVTWKRS